MQAYCSIDLCVRFDLWFCSLSFWCLLFFFALGMSKSNDLSLSFASGIGTEAIADEPFSQPDLYTDLDRLERSVEAEFELYLNQARSFPFHQDGLDSNHEQEESLGDQPSPSRQSISPGAYFGARSLPLNSIWSQQQQSFSDKYENDEEESEPHMEYKVNRHFLCKKSVGLICFYVFRQK